MSLSTKFKTMARAFSRPEKHLLSANSPVPGVGTPRVAYATFDPSANTGDRTVAAHGSGVIVPAGAMITKAWYEVITTFTSANDSGTVALKVEGAGDVVAAIAISDGTNPWDAGIHVITLTPIVTTVDREITATVAVQALTAGRLVLYVEYNFRAS